MNPELPATESADPWWVRLLIILGPILLVLTSAKPYAGGWNDGSRLAAIESLGERSTFSIDDSVFVQVPEELILAGIPPYDPNQPLLLKHGTLDKLMIDRHFYSDKPPVVSLLLAGLYRVWKACGGPSFAERPDITIYWFTVFTSGLAYFSAVWSWTLLGRARRWPRSIRYTLLLGFALGTMAVPYAQYVNAHEMYLGVMSVVCLQLERIRQSVTLGKNPLTRLIFLGTLGGLGYNLDPGLAPGLALGIFGWVVFTLRRWHPVLIFVLATLPWVISHHGVNHAIGGQWLKPLNAVPEYFDYPGSPFNAQNITGFWQHASVLKFLLYVPDLMFGKQGFLTHNLPMMMIVSCLPLMAFRRLLSAEHVAGLIFVGLGYLSYAVLSKNHGGGCCSVRWFAPFLAVGYFIIGDWLTKRPDQLVLQQVLTVGGMVLAIFMAWVGPWTLRMVPGFWPILGCIMIPYLVLAFKLRRASPVTSQ